MDGILFLIVLFLSFFQSPIFTVFLQIYLCLVLTKSSLIIFFLNFVLFYYVFTNIDSSL